MITDVILSNGKTVKVRRLGLFELEDNLTQPHIEPYTVTVLFANGEIYNQPFDLSIERKKPDAPMEDCKENTAEYYQWLEYNRWQDGLVYEQQRINQYAKYCYQVSAYIRHNAIDSKLPRSITPEDWSLILEAALCQPVTSADIEEAIKQLKGQYNDEPLLDAYANVPKSNGSYDFRVVELDLMMKLGEPEEVYFSRSPISRARLIAKDQIRDMIQALDTEASLKAAESNG